MIEMVPFKAFHLEDIRKHEWVDQRIKPWILPEQGSAIEALNTQWTVLQDGVPVVIGGIVEYWKGRGEAWLIFSSRLKRSNFVSVFKKVQRFLELSSLRRIEMVIDCDFAQGHRWATLLGFKKEAERMEAYMPAGYDVSLYALVRGR